MKERIIQLLKNHDKDEEIHNSEYPNHKEALIFFLEQNDVYLTDHELEVEEGKSYIDSDGYSGIDATIDIEKIQLNISMTAYYHKGWDFYINEVKEAN